MIRRTLPVALFLAACSTAEVPAEVESDPIVGTWTATSLTYEDGLVEPQPEGAASENGETWEEMEIRSDFTGRHVGVEVEEDGDEPDGLYVERGTSPLVVSAESDGAYAIAVSPFYNGRMDMQCTLSASNLACTTDQQVDGYFEVIASTWTRVDALRSDGLTVDEDF